MVAGVCYWPTDQVFGSIPYSRDHNGLQTSRAERERRKKWKCSWHVGWSSLSSFLEDLHHKQAQCDRLPLSGREWERFFFSLFKARCIALGKEILPPHGLCLPTEGNFLQSLIPSVGSFCCYERQIPYTEHPDTKLINSKVLFNVIAMAMCSMCGCNLHFAEEAVRTCGVYMLVCGLSVCMCVYRPEDNIPQVPTSFLFLRGDLPLSHWLRACPVDWAARLASPGIHLSPPLWHWDYRHTSPYLALLF